MNPGEQLPTRVPLLNVANMLTMLRVALVPVFLLALLADAGQSTSWRLVAAALFGIASVTDQLDGAIARRRRLVTWFGTVADPLADKALMGAALIGLSALAVLPWWVTAVILARELGVTAIRFGVQRHGAIPSSRGGKLKTLTQSVAIALFVLPLYALVPASLGTPVLVTALRWTLMGAALALTVLTGAGYVRQAVLLRARARAGTRTAPTRDAR